MSSYMIICVNIQIIMYAFYVILKMINVLQIDQVNQFMKKKSLPKNYLLLDFFFNKKQKEILQRSYRKKKEETKSKLLVNRQFTFFL